MMTVMTRAPWAVDDDDYRPQIAPSVHAMRLRLLRLSAIVADRREIEAHRAAGSRLTTHDAPVGGRS